MKKTIAILFTLVSVLMFSSGFAAEERVSILGDSYSTFKGWIPQGNAIYYPYKHVDVKNAE